VSEPSKYRITLDELEGTAKPAPEQLIEAVDADGPAASDPRGPEPDRGWFAAGG
jgi:hypothetical protein